MPQPCCRHLATAAATGGINFEDYEPGIRDAPQSSGVHGRQAGGQHCRCALWTCSAGQGRSAARCAGRTADSPIASFPATHQVVRMPSLLPGWSDPTSCRQKRPGRNHPARMRRRVHGLREASPIAPGAVSGRHSDRAKRRPALRDIYCHRCGSGLNIETASAGRVPCESIVAEVPPQIEIRRFSCGRRAAAS